MAAGAKLRSRSPFLQAVRGMSVSGWIGFSILVVFTLLALLGPLLAPYSPTAQNLDGAFQAPSAAHWLGTDEQGTDLLSMLLHGARIAAIISGSVIAINVLVGVSLGVIAGALGGWVEELIMRVIDVLLAFPGLLLNLAIVAVVKKPGVGHLVFALCINGWVGYARMARGQVLALRNREFVEAARAIGVSRLGIMRRHLLPNITSPIIVQATLGFANVILIESALSFLGFGAQMPYSWGALLDQGQTYLWLSTRYVLAPGIAIAVVVLGFNLLGDGLRDRLDPKRQNS